MAQLHVVTTSKERTAERADTDSIPLEVNVFDAAWHGHGNPTDCHATQLLCESERRDLLNLSERLSIRVCPLLQPG